MDKDRHIQTRQESPPLLPVRCLFGFGVPDAVWRRPRRFASL